MRNDPRVTAPKTAAALLIRLFRHLTHHEFLLPFLPQSGDQGEDVVTKAPLTGIPQVDYVWDPNLPRELRG